MYQFRIMLAIVFTCVAFVGVAAAIKASGFPSGDRLIADASTDRDAALPQPLSVDQSFFVTETSTTVAQAKSLPRAAPADPVSADAYLVGDVSTGKIYLEKNDLAILPFASMSKIITAIAATDMYPSPDALVTIGTSSMTMPPDGSSLQLGERFTVKELLYPMLMNSSNVAAEALSSFGDRIKFLEEMSGYAWEIGMPGSFFADPTGLSSRNAGTASGFFAMARYLYGSRPDILAVTRTKEMSVATTTYHGAHTYTNIHPFVNDPRFLGGKTGHTDEALDTMLTIMNIDGHPLAFIVLHSKNQRALDTSLLIERATEMLSI